MSPSKAKHHFNLKKYVDMEASSGTTEFLSRVRDILIKPTSIRTYDDVLELKKHLKPMDFVNSLEVLASLQVLLTSHLHQSVVERLVIDFIFSFDEMNFVDW